MTGAAYGPWNGIPSAGTGVVTFEDPYNEMSGGISLLASGGYGPGVGIR